MSSNIGTVLRIERASIHDGPGLRTVVFLKGCPLKCKWCSTPESQSFSLEKGYIENSCALCGTCVTACVQEAILISENKININANRCINSFDCVEVCPNNALEIYGKHMTVEDVIKEVIKDEVFFFYSGGGITISGGEVLAQPDFAKDILKKSKELGINTTIETSLYGDFKNVEKILPWIDFLYVDIKHMDRDLHIKWTGVDNATILDNIRRVDNSDYQFDLYIRIPLISGINDDDNNLTSVAKFCKDMKKLKTIEILPYHRLGIETYKRLGRKYELIDLLSPSREHIIERVKYLSKLAPSIKLKAGGGF